MDARPRNLRLQVAGELFELAVSTERPGRYHFAWLSGPNNGYGFTSASSDDSAMSELQMEAEIRGFLKQIDPNTGYLE